MFMWRYCFIYLILFHNFLTLALFQNFNYASFLLLQSIFHFILLYSIFFYITSLIKIPIILIFLHSNCPSFISTVLFFFFIRIVLSFFSHSKSSTTFIRHKSRAKQSPLPYRTQLLPCISKLVALSASPGRTSFHHNHWYNAILSSRAIKPNRHNIPPKHTPSQLFPLAPLTLTGT